MTADRHSAQAVPAHIAQGVSARLAAAIGLDPSAIGLDRMAKIAATRSQRAGLAETTPYLRYLDENPAELQALIEEVVVPETRFFRDTSVFRQLLAWLPSLVKTFPGPLRVLSAPCGTGQEAYSLAAAFLQSGIPASRFTIDAIDISNSALDIARQAVYSSSSVRHLPAELRHLCVEPSGDAWQIRPELRQLIQFERRNLAQPGALGDSPAYHLIFCRNLFIYLHIAARNTLATSLAQALIPGGRLIVGTADRVEELSSRFVTVQPVSSFALQLRTIPPLVAPVPVSTPLPPPALKSVLQQLPPIPTAASDAEELYLSAVYYRQSGNLRKAERRCRQALYLAPDYLPALEMLQQFWQQNPRTRHRDALRNRILRVRSFSQQQETP